MTKLSRDDVLKLARLARIELTEDEIDEFAGEFTSILEYVEQLRVADISGLKPTYQTPDLQNVMRPDEVKDYGYQPADLLKNAPKTEGDQIKVKRMIT